MEAIVGAVYLETGFAPHFNGCCEKDVLFTHGGKSSELLHFLFSLL
jgi:hypothetical protein